VEDVTIAQHDVTLRSYPGERARIVGRLWTTRQADGVIIRDLALDGRNAAGLPSPTVNGDDVHFIEVDVTNRHTGICFLLGSERYGRAERTLIARSRVHDCGRQPATNTDHGIYIAVADHTRVLDNNIYDNADRGIQLYPDAQATLIRGNVIDSNGEGVIFSGAGQTSSDGNIVERNVITNSRIRADVESYYPDGTPAGVGNVVRYNCIYGGASGEIDAAAGGFAAGPNTIADPRYRDPRKGDYTVDPTSACVGVLPGR
jgi:parallel beta-helix repeat protein